MSEPTEPALPRLHTAAEVAQALRQTERFVREKARQGVWPHRRGARGAPLFSDENYARILELMAVPERAQPEPGWSFAPRSGIGRTR